MTEKPADGDLGRAGRMPDTGGMSEADLPGAAADGGERNLSASLAGVAVRGPGEVSPDDRPGGGGGDGADRADGTGGGGTLDDGEPDDGEPDDGAGPDWAWVEEWRESGEPPAWAPGITVAAFTALVVGMAVFVLSEGLADIPWLAVTANVLVAAGLTPALWLSRRLPVLRWIAAGAAVGLIVGWIGALIS